MGDRRLRRRARPVRGAPDAGRRASARRSPAADVASPPDPCLRAGGQARLACRRHRPGRACLCVDGPRLPRPRRPRGLDLLHPARRHRRRRAPRPLHPCLRPAGDRLLCRGDRPSRGARSRRRDAGLHRAAHGGARGWRLRRGAAAERRGAAAESTHAPVRGPARPVGMLAAGTPSRAYDAAVRSVRHALLPRSRRRRRILHGRPQAGRRPRRPHRRAWPSP